MRSRVVVGPFFIALTVACSSGLHPFNGPDSGSAGGGGGLIASSSRGGATGLPGTASATGGATGGTPNRLGGTTTGIPSTGGVTGSGGVSGAGGIPQAGGTGGSSIALVGACANLTCLNPLAGLLAACDVSTAQTCTQQTTVGLSIGQNQCFSNGVKTQTLISLDISSATITYKTSSSVCYALKVTGLNGNVMNVVVQDKSGAIVATITQDTTSAAATATVTCPGGTPTIVDASCGTLDGLSNATGPTCTDGTCAF